MVNGIVGHELMKHEWIIDCPMNSLVRVVYVAVPMHESPLHAHRVHGHGAGKHDVGLHIQEFFHNLKDNKKDCESRKSL